MGAVFIGGQALEYAELIQEGVTIPDSAYGTMFYLDHRLPRPARDRRPDRLPVRARPHVPGHASSPTSRPSAPSSCPTTGTSSTWSGSACSPRSTSSSRPHRSTDRQHGKDSNVRLLNRSAGRLSRHRRSPLAGAGRHAARPAADRRPLLRCSRPRQAQQTVSADEQVAQGRELFLVGCSFCHGQNGEGVRTDRRQPARPLAGRRRRRRGRLPGRHRPDADGPARPAGAGARRSSTPTRRSPPWRRTSPRSAPARPSPTSPTTPSTGFREEEREEAIARGGQIFLTNCTACHNFDGSGGAMPRGGYAPTLDKAAEQAHLRGPADRPRSRCRPSPTATCRPTRSAT